MSIAALIARAERKAAEMLGPPDAVEFARTLGIEPDPWQERVLRWRGKRLLLNCSRQAGKSSTAAIVALHRAVYTPKSLVLLISPSLRQSGELFRKVTDLLALMKPAPKRSEDNKLSLTLDNGSRIVSLPSSEETVRGFSAVSLIIEDEAAWVDDRLHDAMMPMLAVSDGQMILMSTPNGRRGHFFEAWERAGDVWTREHVRGDQVPRISAAFLAEQRATKGERFRQEYEGAFINAATGRVYDGFDEDRNLVDAPPEPITRVVVGLDFGIVDQNAVTVLGWRKHERVVYVLSSYKLTGGPSDVAAEVQRVSASYRPDQLVGDIGGMGKAFEHEMRTRHNLPLMAAQKHDKVGHIALMNDALRRGEVRVVRPTCTDLVNEWLTLPWADSVEDRSEHRQREAPGYDNHASDSALYAWRAAYAFLEKPEPVKLDPATPEWEDAQWEKRARAAKAGASKKEWWRR